MLRRPSLAILLFVALGFPSWGVSQETQDSVAASKSLADSTFAEFNFSYAGALTNLEEGELVRVWLPIATSNHEQEVTLLEVELPGKSRRTREQKFGNELLFFEATANQAGEVPFQIEYHVKRLELTRRNYEEDRGDVGQYLAASTFVPIDERIRTELLGKEEPIRGNSLAVANQLYSAVLSHMTYDKPTERPGWGKGNAIWACENGYGNCTDFHSLFISAARSLEIPARFEIGFSIPEARPSGQIGGYHCWAKFMSNEDWIPVDISEADKEPNRAEYFFGNLTENRVQISQGRDLVLQPAAAVESVNFLVYPYAEVKGQPHMSLRKDFRYEWVTD